MIGRILMMTVAVGVGMFAVGVAHSTFKHYRIKYAEDEDLRDADVMKVVIVADESVRIEEKQAPKKGRSRRSK
jgi:hypothetical protein